MLCCFVPVHLSTCSPSLSFHLIYSNIFCFVLLLMPLSNSFFCLFAFWCCSSMSNKLLAIMMSWRRLSSVLVQRSPTDICCVRVRIPNTTEREGRDVPSFSFSPLSLSLRLILVQFLPPYRKYSLNGVDKLETWNRPEQFRLSNVSLFFIIVIMCTTTTIADLDPQSFWKRRTKYQSRCLPFIIKVRVSTFLRHRRCLLFIWMRLRFFQQLNHSSSAPNFPFENIKYISTMASNPSSFCRKIHNIVCCAKEYRFIRRTISISSSDSVKR